MSAQVYVYMAISFVALIALTRWINRHVQGIGYLLTGDGQIALMLYFLLILPGVILHELSHALAAVVLFVPVRRISVGVRRKGRSNQVALGSVEIARTDPLRASLIGAAPLVAGCAAILVISSSVLRLTALPPFGEPGFWSGLGTIYGTPDFWLWIYLVLAIGNAMVPSAADRSAWGTALVFIAFVGGAFYFSGLLAAVGAPLGRWAQTAASQLTYAFAFTAAVNVIFVVLLFLIEQLLGLLGLGRVQYQ